MAEEHTQQPSPRGKSRRERVEHARSRDILDVASELSIELVQSGRDYRWKEHDSMVISPEKNMWNWFSRHQGGDVIALVQTMKEVNFNQAIDFLNDGTFKEFTHLERVQEPFTYYLQPYEQPFEDARNYLKEQRGLSDETIDFFLEKGVLAQANAMVNGSIEPVVVFKSFDFSGEIVGATLQGIEENWEKWPERGYAKKIVRNSDGTTGMHVDIGQPNRLIFAESAIDLMSYYELNKKQLSDVRLVSMDGLKEGVVGHHLAQLQSDISGKPLNWSREELSKGLQIAIDRNFFTDGKHADWITLAVDNDEGGQNFVESLQDKGAPVISDLPELQPNQEKMDWNDYLKQEKSTSKQVYEADLIASGKEVSSTEYLSTVARKDLPANIQANEKVQELLGQVEELGQAAHFWVTEEDLNQPKEIVSRLDDWFSSGKVDEVYQSTQFELTVGDYTYMIEFKDGNKSLQNMEDYAKYISEQINTVGLEDATSELETVIADFNQIKQAITESMAKEIVILENNRKLSKEPLQPQEGTPIDQLKTLDEVKKENEALVKRLENRIKTGNLSISFDTDMYLYDVFSNLGNSHPIKYINDKRRDVLAPIRPILSSIDEKNVNLYKTKGTMEQDSLYQALKPHQRTLGVTVSTQFIAELAIAAYSTNKQLDRLSDEYYSDATLDNLSQSIARMLEYPLNETGITDDNYRYMTIPNAFYHHLEESEGNLILSRSDLDSLLSRIEKQPLQIVETRKEEIAAVSDEKEKSLEMNQETNTGGELFNRNSSFLGEDSPGTAPQPVEPKAQPIFPTNVHIHFTTDDGNMSNKAFRKNLRTLNLYANTMRDSAQWYLSEVADTTMIYIYKTPQEEGVQILNVHFGKKNWMHLTGVTPVYENWVDSLSEQFIDDIANGKGHFKNLKFALGTPDKLKVLNLLPEIIESDTFVFNDLTSVKKLSNLDLSQALNPEDSDLLLLFRGEGLHQVPASLMRIKGELTEKLSNIDSGTVLGVYRERNGQLEQISINEDYVRDGGQEMMSILENKQYEEPVQPSEPISAELFTQVLDTACNIGEPRKLGSSIPEEFKATWERYYELSDIHAGNFSAVVNAADQLNLVNKNSHFYQEWNQDRIYNENYHVRLQLIENWPDAPQLPFNETDLVDYQTFAKELYKQNRTFYEPRQERIAAGNQDNYPQNTKVKFDVYAPGGNLIKDNVSYDIGNETKPISRLLGLGYRRLEGQSELAVIDERVLSQLDNQELNQEIATEVNEQNLRTQEVLSNEVDQSRRNFRSPNQEIKERLAQRIEEIMAEDSTEILVSSIPEIQENLSVEKNLISTIQEDNRMLYTNREDFGRGYQLELVVYSLSEIDNLSDVESPWTLAIFKGEKQLGYLAYGSDWGNDFQIEEELESLAEQINSGNPLEGLYPKEEVDVFLASNFGNKDSQEYIPTVVNERFDYASASAYDISEHAFQKIREYTQNPEDLMEYIDFMSKFPRLSPRNVALIHDQWRGANAVATYDQWQVMGEALGIKPEDVIQTKATYTNRRTGETKEVIHQGLSVKTGEKSQITLFRPLMVRMIPVLDENGYQIKNEKGNPKYKKLSEATPPEKVLVKDGKLPVRQFQERDPKTGKPRFTTYKVFELSQTTLKPESYPKAMPNRHYNFNVDNVKTKEMLEGLCDYAESIGVKMMKDGNHVLGNAKGAFFPEEQIILINPDNTPGEKIATTIHELAHATLHNPKLSEQYKELPKGQKEFEAEMTSHLLSKHFGLDTSEKAIDYMAKWTDNLQRLNDKQLADSLKRIHKTVSKMHKQIEYHTKPYQQGKNRGQSPNFPKAPTKGPSR